MTFVAIGGLLASLFGVYLLGGPGTSAAQGSVSEPVDDARPAAAPVAPGAGAPEVTDPGPTPPDAAERSTVPDADDEQADGQEPADAAAVDPADPGATRRFAQVVGDLDLHLPSDDLVVVGFHEASSRDAIAMTPVGTITDHQNTTKFDPPADDPRGPDYLVLSSRGRPRPATSAADLVYADGVAILAPVDGEVVDVREYFLYGRHLDHRIEIVPDAAPHLRVVLIHVDGVVVAVGDRVEAGRTVVAAGVRRFPFASHIDRYTEPARHGHVHLEVQPVDARRPGDETSGAHPDGTGADPSGQDG